VTTQAADVGFTAKSVVLSPTWKQQGAWLELEEQLYAPIKQSAVILTNRTTQQKDAQQFLEFVRSATGKQILEDFGYQAI